MDRRDGPRRKAGGDGGENGRSPAPLPKDSDTPKHRATQPFKGAAIRTRGHMGKGAQNKHMPGQPGAWSLMQKLDTAQLHSARNAHTRTGCQAMPYTRTRAGKVLSTHGAEGSSPESRKRSCGPIAYDISLRSGWNFYLRRHRRQYKLQHHWFLGTLGIHSAVPRPHALVNFQLDCILRACGPVLTVPARVAAP